MRIQLAVDRVSIPEAISIIQEAKDSIDIIEIGTSLFKDYGLHALHEIKDAFDIPIFADIKTIDEAAYEFNQIYKAGADIASVMGVSSIESIRICQQVAQSYGKQYLIDTMEMSEDKIKALTEFEDAILCLHLPKDKAGDLQAYVTDFLAKYQLKNKVAVAGGVKMEYLESFKEIGVDMIVVGSAITKSKDIKGQAAKFKELCA